MKKLIFQIALFTFLFTQNGFSQCAFYPYILNITDFVCENGEGQVCFETMTDNWDVTTFEDCADLIVEISYPTPNFVTTDLGDFSYSEDSGTNTSKLTYAPPSIFHLVSSGCFEGLIQVPNTTFTLTILSASDPSEIYTTTTFSLENIVTVGTPGQTTALSTLTGTGGPLLPPAQAMGNGQRVVVEGTLEVDIPYWFTSVFPSEGEQYSELIMMPGSKIEVKEGVTLYTSWANIHGCDGTWDRINLQPGVTQNGATLDMGKRTTLKGAAVGVEMNDDTKFDFLDSEISDCDIGVASFGPQFQGD